MPRKRDTSHSFPINLANLRKYTFLPPGLNGRIICAPLLISLAGLMNEWMDECMHACMNNKLELLPLEHLFENRKSID